MPINVCVPGISGKMGLEIAKLILSESSAMLLSAAITRKSKQQVNKYISIDNNIITADIDYGISKSDVCIDFTRPENTMLLLEKCIKYNKKLVIGTTGFTNSQILKITDASNKIAILKASNMSIGINLCLKLVEKISLTIGDISDIDIIEYHHKHKVDMPSGTSLAFEDVIKKNTKNTKDVRHHCLRIGNVVGDHIIKFTLENESIEINHKSFDRKIFAEGAVLAAKWINNKEKGLFGMNNVLSL